MKCSPEFRKRVAEQAELARRKTGRGYTGQLFFTYGEVKWVLADLQELHDLKAEQVLRDSDDPRRCQPARDVQRRQDNPLI